MKLTELCQVIQDVSNITVTRRIGVFRRKTGYIDEKEKVYDSLRGRSVECSRL